MRLRIAGNELILLVLIYAGFTALLLFGTAEGITFWRSYEGGWKEAPAYYKLAASMDLADEDNIASWFSSMLLATIAWLAAVCFVLDRKCPGSHWLDYGWVVMCLIFLALSFDELGSVHERLQLPEGLAGWILWYAPVVAVLPLYLGLFAFFRMRQDKPALLLVALGSLAFASIPIQEQFEVGVDRGADWQRPVAHILLEEGAELVAMLLILAAFVRYALAFRRTERASGDEAIEFALKPVSFALIIAVIFAGGLLAGEIATILLEPDELSGTPRNWFPAFSSLGAACLVALWPERRWSARGIALGQLTMVCVTASMLLAGGLHHLERVAPAFLVWLALAWLVGAIALRAAVWIIGSALWAGTLSISFSLLPVWAAPFGLAASSLFLILTLIAYARDGQDARTAQRAGFGPISASVASNPSDERGVETRPINSRAQKS